VSHPSPWARAARPRSRDGECDPFRRIGARVIDVLVLAPFFAVLVPLGHRHHHAGLSALGLLVVSAAYEIVSVGAFGRSLGKLATRVRVVAADGARATWGQAVVRWLTLSGVAAVLGSLLGYASLLWGAVVLVLVLIRGLGPHDHAARTKVISDDARPPILPTSPGNPANKERSRR
jgi:uncharacterized RDD family membrane protein YckC